MDNEKKTTYLVNVRPLHPIHGEIKFSWHRSPIAKYTGGLSAFTNKHKQIQYTKHTKPIGEHAVYNNNEKFIK